MKVSMHNWMRPEPIQADARAAGRLGYDAGQVRSLFDEHDLECWGAVTLMTGGRDLLHEIGDASEAGGGAGIEKFLRDHATGAVPEALNERYTEDSIAHLRAALGAAV